MIPFWWTSAYEKPQSHHKRLLWGLMLSSTQPVTSRDLAKMIPHVDIISTYCSYKHSVLITTYKGN